ncbi:MAG: hypothetical protein OXC99_03730 [Chloroflexi bacterium]|nr:hypothetical protein [Chloroflexota bacterium]
MSTATPVPATTVPTAVPTPASTPTPEQDPWAAFWSIPWIADGVRPVPESGSSGIYDDPMKYEVEYVALLEGLGHTSPRFFSVLVRESWVRDGFNRVEMNVFSDLLDIGFRDEEAALRIMGLPIFDAITLGTHSIVDTLSQLLERSGQLALRSVLEHPSLDVSSHDRMFLSINQLGLAQENPRAAEDLDSLPWVADGVSPAEAPGFITLAYLAVEHDALFDPLFAAVMAKHWMQDDFTANERRAVIGLQGIARGIEMDGLSTALRILRMPFMDSVNGADGAAADSLGDLFWSLGGDAFRQLLEHPALVDGITDDQAVQVGMLPMTAPDRPDLTEALLDPSRITIDKRDIQLPHTGDVVLAVVHVTPGAQHPTMDILERMVRHHEAFMGIPYRWDYIAVLVADVNNAAGGGGPAALLTIDPGREPDALLIAHELAHVYWPYSPGGSPKARRRSWSA